MASASKPFHLGPGIRRDERGLGEAVPYPAGTFAPASLTHVTISDSTWPVA